MKKKLKIMVSLIGVLAMISANVQIMLKRNASSATAELLFHF